MGDQIQKMLGTAVYAVYEGSALHKTEPFKSGPDATLVMPAWHEDKTPCENEAYPNSTESTARKLLLKGLQRRMVDAGFAEDLRSGKQSEDCLQGAIRATIESTLLGEIRSMNYRLTPELEEFIRVCTDSGDYGDASEVVRDALSILKLRREHETQKLKRLREAVKEGRDAADRGDYVELNDDKELEGFFARL